MLLEAFILHAARRVRRRAPTPVAADDAEILGAGPRERADVIEQVARLEREADRLSWQRLEGQKDSRPEPAAGQGRMVPLYRKVEPGERRVEGLLERINCTAKGIALDVSVEDTIERFAAPSLIGVAFISHREDLRGGIACGPRTPPDRVYVTWRQDDSPGGVRRVVAVEFLPKPR